MCACVCVCVSERESLCVNERVFFHCADDVQCAPIRMRMHVSLTVDRYLCTCEYIVDAQIVCILWIIWVYVRHDVIAQ